MKFLPIIESTVGAGPWPAQRDSYGTKPVCCLLWRFHEIELLRLAGTQNSGHGISEVTIAVKIARSQNCPSGQRQIKVIGGQDGYWVTRFAANSIEHDVVSGNRDAAETQRRWSSNTNRAV